MKPRSKLPWTAQVVSDEYEHPDASSAEVVTKGNKLVCEYCYSDDARYIAHAANAYPKLVEALRSSNARLRAMQREFESPRFTDRYDYSGTCKRAADYADSLLHELGEDA